LRQPSPLGAGAAEREGMKEIIRKYPNTKFRPVKQRLSSAISVKLAILESIDLWINITKRLLQRRGLPGIHGYNVIFVSISFIDYK